jgi:hypothetical protein
MAPVRKLTPSGIGLKQALNKARAMRHRRLQSCVRQVLQKRSGGFGVLFVQGIFRLMLNDGDGEPAAQRGSGRGLAFDWITADFVR